MPLLDYVYRDCISIEESDYYDDDYDIDRQYEEQEEQE